MSRVICPNFGISCRWATSLRLQAQLSCCCCRRSWLFLMASLSLCSSIICRNPKISRWAWYFNVWRESWAATSRTQFLTRTGPKYSKLSEKYSKSSRANNLTGEESLKLESYFASLSTLSSISSVNVHMLTVWQSGKALNYSLMIPSTS